MAVVLFLVLVLILVIILIAFKFLPLPNIFKTLVRKPSSFATLVSPPATPLPRPTASEDPRCLETHFDLPHTMNVGERYDGYFYVTNSTDETVVYGIVFETNLGSHGPTSAHVTGLPQSERSVGFAIYEVDQRARGTIKATVTVEGDTTPCSVENHRVKVE